MVAASSAFWTSGSGDEAALEAKLGDHATHYFENIWIHKPLKALSGNTPVDAVGSKVLRKHVFGVEVCGEEIGDAVLRICQPRDEVIAEGS